jgi:MoaA/NifB/PqqE/SkfB family radical SAM enzyme
VESTNACNLKCPHCAAAAGNWGNKKVGFMDFELFKKIIDEAAAEGCYCIKFSLRGEPLIHPKIIDMVSYVAKSGIIDFYFNTNGILLTEEKITALINAGLKRISVSVDGWNKESFDAFRAGADYDVVCGNIIKFMEIRKKLGVDYPKMRVQTVMLPEMKPHWDEYSKKWSGIADEVGYLDARDEGPEFDHRGVVNNKFKCPFLWQRMTILWDGTLLPCLMHGIEDFSLMALGNVKDLSIKEMWHSAVENNYRELHSKGLSHEVQACDLCSYRAMEIRKITNNAK